MDEAILLTVLYFVHILISNKQLNIFGMIYVCIVFVSHYIGHWPVNI